MRLILCDLNEWMVAAWGEAFAGCPDVEVYEGDLLEMAADAYVSPANSFGDMSGGIDLDLRLRFGQQLEDAVQGAIRNIGGMLPVGQALVVETGDGEVPYLVCAPTMEVPMHVAHTNNAYLAMRAALRAVERFNEKHPGAIQSIGVPGLCTGVGEMPPEVAARQMRAAYSEWLKRSAAD
jgi:O-acetyl-ADP-ribose deacetylase (regulator of RNase III)